MSSLDLLRLAKVVSLARSQPHDDSEHAHREREAAWAAAGRIADQGGVTLDEALSALDEAEAEAAAQQERGGWEAFEEWLQRRADRGRKQRAGKRRAAARRRAEAGLSAWQDHPRELALRHALRGHDAADMSLLSHELTLEAQQAVRDAIPWPATMREAIAEEAFWNELEASRKPDDRRYRLEDGPYIRRDMLRRFLEGEAQSPEDMVARAAWLTTRGGRGLLWDDLQSAWLQTVAGDLARMLTMLEEARAGNPCDGQGAGSTPLRAVSNREKRERVRAILAEPGGDDLSLRDLARRAGVSVQGAANLKEAISREAVNA